MLYTDAVHQNLITEMDQYYKDLDGYKEALVAARDKLIKVGWEENESAVAFQQKVDVLLGEEGLGDTHLKLEKLRDAIDYAFNNAKAADQKVYNAF
ncbi:hypothetical protein AB0L63_07050 [Nocardia sp. NPDC051990]|uniref:hypothetical protein n=1 Tax=Nocardia sp. NPDC051990 TaxID=3155285 RepID=UPI00343C9822